MEFRLTEEDKKFINTCTVTQTTIGGGFSVVVNFSTHLNNARDRSNSKLVKGDSISVTGVLSPFSNCQLASFKSFCNVIYNFTTDFYPNNPFSKEMKRHRQIAILLALRNVNKLITNKRLFMIDIREEWWNQYREIVPIFAGKAYRKNEVEYISTNGSNMMHTIIHLDKDRLKELFEGTFTKPEWTVWKKAQEAIKARKAKKTKAQQDKEDAIRLQMLKEGTLVNEMPVNDPLVDEMPVNEPVVMGRGTVEQITFHAGAMEAVSGNEWL